MASTESTGITTGQPNLQKQDLSKLVSVFFTYLFSLEIITNYVIQNENFIVTIT